MWPGSEAGDGGGGGAAHTPDGEDGLQYTSNPVNAAQGGGGGGAGRIRINTFDDGLSIAAGAIVSPSTTPEACDGLCSTGDLATY